MIFRTTTASLFCAALAHAQCEPSRGFFIGAPISITLAQDKLVPLAHGQVLHKARGFLHTTPKNSALGSGPNFDIQAALIQHGANKATPPEIDATSIGQDWILADDATGEAKVPANRWGALTFSVSRTSKGMPNSVIEREAGTADGAAADVFAYTLPGSAIPKELLGHTVRAIDSREIDLGKGDQANINGLDHFIPMYGTDPAVAALMSSTPTIYFSVSNQSIAQNLVPQSWFANQPISGATILKMQWQRPATGGPAQWMHPQPFKSFRELGLLQGDDLDALALDLAQKRVLFSTTNPKLDQILFLKLGSVDFALPVPYTENGTPVSKKIGTNANDDVDAICAIDPTVPGATQGGNAVYFFMGTPQKQTIFPGHDVHASAFRDDSSGAPAWHSHVTGWPKNTGKGPGYAAFYMSFPAAPWPWIPISLQKRDPLNPFCGDPREELVKIPPMVSIKGFSVSFHWLLADINLTEIAEPHPLNVRL